jgi:hypothetical protein
MPQGLGEHLAEIVFHEVAGITVPVAPLLRDMSLAPDQLGVFFGGQPLERLRTLFGKQNDDEPIPIAPQVLTVHQCKHSPNSRSMKQGGDCCSWYLATVHHPQNWWSRSRPLSGKLSLGRSICNISQAASRF